MRFFVIAILVLVTSAFVYTAQREVAEDNVVTHDNFQKGEYLEYKASYGFFNVGEGTFKIQDHVYRINGRPCYKVDAFGKTSGFVGWLSNVDDHWYAYVDTASLLTQVGYRDIIEGRYKKNEITTYSHEDSLISVKNLDHETNKFKEPKDYKAEEITRGMMSGFLYLRSIDFSTLNKGDTLGIKSFLDDTFYDFKLVVYDRENLKTKAGVFKSIVFRPVMPDNSVFEGEDAILAWFSDDENKIPLKVQAKMFIGKAGIELVGYEGLKNEPALVQK
jgi:hypothetical protein